ncbi:hypothetical protein PENTCL1PPCAC_1108 [Pristionchus entomophagus]|uniref:Peptidase S54 rhomboid domain-containing protein n=1 Tax=Pristionchus entomophagus TaxID=358040 RepID=A0AAV5S8C3_9BILA|nr:hypothetical protein PENTCL1PPCAC_1108 [Pristionchus entomophagus]
MPKTPASAGGPRRTETIEMTGMGSSASGPTRKLEKSTSVPLQQRLKTPVSDQQRTIFELGAPPSRNPFQRGNTIREAMGEFVGLSDPPTSPCQSGGSGPAEKWSDRRLQYFNRKFKLSKDYVQSCDAEVHRQATSMSPVGMTGGQWSAYGPGPASAYGAGPASAYGPGPGSAYGPGPGSSYGQVQAYNQAPPTPGLASFQVVIDPQQEARARSMSIESRRPRRESAFKIVTENCASLLTRGRLTPTASTSSRIRRNNATASFTVSHESPLPSTSLTPGPHGGPASPLGTSFSIPMREPPAAEMDPSASAPRTRKREVRRFRRLHRLLEAPLEADEIAHMADEGGIQVTGIVDADGIKAAADAAAAAAADAPRRASIAPPPPAADAPAAAAKGPSRAKFAAFGKSAIAQPVETAFEEEATPSTSFYPQSIQSLIAPEMISPQPRDLPSTSGVSPPPVLLSRPTMLPMGDETTQSIDPNELFFDITPPKRPLRSHPALHDAGPLPLPLDRRSRGGPVPLGRVTPVSKDLLPDRAILPKKVKFMEKRVPLVDTLKRQVEARWHEQRTFRTGGVGAFGECLGRKTKQLEQLPESLKKRLKMTVNERPFFTFWVTFTQLLVCLASICIFGFGAFSPSFAKKEKEVLSLDQTLITVGVYEKGNIWLGPKFADLIRLGAKYSPCMRAEQKIMSRIELDRIAESYTGCCVHTDGFCYQAGEQCPRTLATLLLYRNPSQSSSGLRRTQSSPDLRQASLSTMRRSEIVCGLDPDFCAAPSFHSFSREDITKWPLCERKIEADSVRVGFRPKHLTCEVMGRPCCIHLQGRCRITTQDYCEFVGGIFHEEASLCSQVNCLHGICGMIPFGDSPNQIYRLFTSLFLHAGLLHLGITIFFQMVFMRDLENYIGWKRMAFIYFISGVGGNLASAIFVPFNPEVGPSGALAGIVTTLFVDVFANRDMLQQPLLAIAQNGGWLFSLFVVGFLPWVDNWAILFGTVFGLLATFVFLPDVGLRRGSVFRRFIVIFGAISLLLLFVLLFYIFIENIDIDCTWCGYFNCFNWYRFIAYDPDDGNHFCDNQGLTVNSWLPI